MQVVADMEPANSDQDSGMDIEEREALSVAEMEDQLHQQQSHNSRQVVDLLLHMVQ